MDFEFSADQELLRETVRRYLAERAPISPYVRTMLDDPRGTSAEVWSGLGELGLIGLLIPEAFGGAGMGMVDIAVVVEEMGRAVHPGPFLATAVGTASLLARTGPEAIRSAHLPLLASGEAIGTIALYEPGQRGAWADPEARAERDGDCWALTGVKAHVPDATAADIILVVARADGELGVFLVTAGASGLVVAPKESVDETRKTATVAFDRTPATRLGSGDERAAVAEVVDRIGIAMVVDGVGAAARALELAVEYAKEREQFDRPIGSFQAVQHLCADMLRAVELARAAAYYACWAADAADPAERHRAATMARAFAADGLYSVGAGAIQVFGGIGFTWEHDIHLYYKRLLTLQHAGGGATDQLEELATIVLGSSA